MQFNNSFIWSDEDEENRVTILPIKYPEIWSFRKLLEALHWTAQEVALSRDKKDWLMRMNDEQRHFIKMQFAFFAIADIDVLKNLDDNFSSEITCMEARMVYAAQKDQECVHAESYSLQIEAVMENEERDKIINAVRTMPVIARMREWVLQWFDRNISIGERLVAFAAVEGVLFSALQWLREFNILPGITTYNDFIVRDEGVHTRFACLLIKRYLQIKPSQERIEKIFKSVVDVIDSFVDESLPPTTQLIGMNATLMKQYVRFQADCVLIDMEYTPIYRIENPFRFMDKLSLNEISKTNFFENRPTQYQNVSRNNQSRFEIDDSPINL